MTIAKDKITEIFCMADDFCHIYDRFIKINGLAPKRDKSKRKYHRNTYQGGTDILAFIVPLPSQWLCSSFNVCQFVDRIPMFSIIRRLDVYFLS